MSAEENKRLVQGIFDRMARGDTRAMSEAMADGFRWVFPGDWSWSGTWEPKRVVRNDLLRPLMEQFADYRSEADLILADGDRVVVQAHATATTKRGERYDQTYCFIFRVAEGRLTEVVEHCDTALVERVLDPIPRPASGAGGHQAVGVQGQGQLDDVAGAVEGA
ncbi:nuclear transport factor 2 family protein [Spirillospora sp. NPDC047279]|uniref:nuclear transport factor 2 family protein n=1 Tax=Spirillospora sp. NPDC047279 TaxID=3155478 RepID=UPI003411F452